MECSGRPPLPAGANMAESTYQDAITYCLERSWFLRRLTHARWLIRHAVAALDFASPSPSPVHLNLSIYLRGRVGRIEGIGRVHRWALRSIAAPLIAELVWRWSAERKLDAEQSTWNP